MAINEKWDSKLQIKGSQICLGFVWWIWVTAHWLNQTGPPRPSGMMGKVQPRVTGQQIITHNSCVVDCESTVKGSESVFIARSKTGNNSRSLVHVCSLAKIYRHNIVLLLDIHLIRQILQTGHSHCYCQYQYLMLDIS